MTWIIQYKELADLFSSHSLEILNKVSYLVFRGSDDMHLFKELK